MKAVVFYFFVLLSLLSSVSSPMELYNNKSTARNNEKVFCEREIAIAVKTSDNLCENELQWARPDGSRFAMRHEGLVRWLDPSIGKNCSLSIHGDDPIVFHQWNEHSKQERFAAIFGYYFKIFGYKENKDCWVPSGDSAVEQTGFFEEPKKQNILSLVWSGERTYFANTEKLVWKCFSNGVLKPFEPEAEKEVRLLKVIYHGCKNILGVVTESKEGAAQKIVAIYNAHDLKRITKLKVAFNGDSQLEFHPSEEQLLYFNNEGEFCFHEISNDKVLKYMIDDSNKKHMKFSYPFDGSFYTLSNDSKEVRLFDKQSHTVQNRVNALFGMLCQDGSRLLTAEKDLVKVWKVPSQKQPVLIWSCKYNNELINSK